MTRSDLRNLLKAPLDESLLRDRVRAERAEDALDALQTLAVSNRPVDQPRLTRLLEQLHAKQPQGDGGTSA